MERDRDGASCWQVSLAADGRPIWRSDAEERRTQPARSDWQRSEDVFLKLFPSNDY
jgi:hypothetical protein